MTDTLTPRQREILELLAQSADMHRGHDATAARYLAATLGISRTAADDHLHRLRLKGAWGAPLPEARPLPPPPPTDTAALLRDLGNFIRTMPTATYRDRDARNELLGRITRALGEG